MKTKAKPSPLPTTTVADPIVEFASRAQTFFSHIVPTIQEVGANLPGQPNADPLKLADGLGGLTTCSATLSVDLGVVPSDPRATTAQQQLTQACGYFASSAAKLRIPTVVSVRGALDDLKAAVALVNSAADILGLPRPFNA